MADLKQTMENEIKKHNLEKSELVNKITGLAEQGKLARVIININELLIFTKPQRINFFIIN